MTKLRRLTIALCLALSLAAPRPAHALSPETRAFLVAGLYGIAAGTVLGLVSFPVTKDARTIGLGASMGLYFGMVVGAYHVTHLNDPENPLAAGAIAPPREVRVAISVPVYRF